MKKFLALFLSAVMVLTVGVAAAAQGDDRVHITYSYWGTPDEATSTRIMLLRTKYSWN
jgi:hypothetical protein